MSERTLSIMALIVFIAMVISSVYMILKSFSSISKYIEIISEEEMILEKCLMKFNSGYKYLEINPEIHNFRFELQEKIEKIAVNNGYVFLKKSNNTLYFKKKEK